MKNKKQRIGDKKKEYLLRIIFYEEKINSLQRHLKSIEHQKTQVKAIDYAKEQVKGGNKNSWEALIDKTDKYKQNIIDTCNKLIDLRQEALDLINAVESPKHSLLLTMMYVEGMSLQKVADHFGLTYNTIKQWHSEALSMIRIAN